MRSSRSSAALCELSTSALRCAAAAARLGLLLPRRDLLRLQRELRLRGRSALVRRSNRRLRLRLPRHCLAGGARDLHLHQLRPLVRLARQRLRRRPPALRQSQLRRRRRHLGHGGGEGVLRNRSARSRLGRDRLRRGVRARRRHHQLLGSGGGGGLRLCRLRLRTREPILICEYSELDKRAGFGREPHLWTWDTKRRKGHRKHRKVLNNFFLNGHTSASAEAAAAALASSARSSLAFSTACSAASALPRKKVTASSISPARAAKLGGEDARALGRAAGALRGLHGLRA
ncbi:hypothetical protein T492DRAFT_465531 [Pavlovales sp. CCMP2436]|nr:hypothetical protein T492DRAFT_465531 [Pavlovales sp. CCMP2436]